MATSEIEIRVTALENELAALKQKLSVADKSTPWWQKVAGVFADDADFDEAMKLGREYRLAQREEK